MTSSSDPFQLTILYEVDEQGWTTATIPAVPGTISAGRNRREARDNALDALREMLAVAVPVPQGAASEGVEVRLEQSRAHDRGHER